MKKLVILGCENSHANAFLDLITQEPEFAHLEVIGVYSEDAEAARKLQETYGVPVMAAAHEAAGQVDGVIITARHGCLHYAYAKPYIASGVPMFVDKPITVSEEEAIAFMGELKKRGVPATGGSLLRFHSIVRQVRQAFAENVDGNTVGGIVRAPLQPDSPYGGFYFYAQHLVEMVMEIFGRYPRAVQVSVDEGQNRTVLFHYEGFTVTGLYTNGGSQYYAVRFSRKGCQGGPVNTNFGDAQREEFREFAHLLQGGEMELGYGELIAPVFVMNAIERAAVSGRIEPVCYVEV